MLHCGRRAIPNPPERRGERLAIAAPTFTQKVTTEMESIASDKNRNLRAISIGKHKSGIVRDEVSC